jgi:hypothetical protein
MNLRDQLKQAKLLSDKKAKQLAHEARVERTEKGREAIEQEAQQRRDERLPPLLHTCPTRQDGRMCSVDGRDLFDNWFR